MKSFAASLLALAALVLPSASAVRAADLEWNQDRAAELAQGLIEPLDALWADLESRPAVPGKEAALAAVMNDIKHLRLRAKELAKQLAGGAGRAETVALFREVKALQSQAAKHAREYPAPFDMHVYVERIGVVTMKLAQYYGESSDS